MPRAWWGIWNNTGRVWLAMDRAHTTDPTHARKFGTWERADQFLRVHAPDFIGAWLPKLIPATEPVKRAA